MKQVRRKIFSLCVLFLSGFSWLAEAADVEVHFSPKRDCQTTIIALLDGATNSVYVQQYTFTAKPLVLALIRVKERGVSVRVVLDARQSANRATATLLRAGGVPVVFDAQHSIAHNKVAVIDHGVVVCGSYNWTLAAEVSNAENLLVLRDASVATLYEGNFLVHEHHSK